MSKNPAAAVIVQRLMTPAEVGEYLRADGAWFAQARPRLEARGFPRPLPEIDRYNRVAVDELCHRYGIPLFVLHDFDKAGFSIAATLQRDTRRYKFQNRIEVIDLGLRLADVEAYGLERERVHSDDNPEAVCANLRRNGASEEEITFLLTHRVELNAFAPDALAEWITAKLERHGVKKVIPDMAVLTEAYRRRHQSRFLNEHFVELVDRSRQHVENLNIPADLRERVAQRLQEKPLLSWNDAVAEIATTQIS